MLSRLLWSPGARKLGALILVAVMFAGCTAPATAPPTAAPTAAPAAPAAPATAAPAAAAKPAAATASAATGGGTLRFAVTVDMSPKNPHRLLEANYPWLQAIYDTLTRYDAKLQPQPWLAESWQWSPDNLQLTMKIRKGVKFHSGHELTAEDVEWNLKRVADKNTNSQLQPTAAKITDIARPDDYTLVLTFKTTAPEFFDLTEQMAILDPTTIDSVTSGGKQSGTGPFMWVEWVPGSKWTFERNPNYWQGGQSNISRIEFTVVPDRDSLVMNLEAGAVDMILSPNAKDAVRLQADSKYRVILSTNEAPRLYIGVVTTAKPFDDKRVRQALNYAVPRDRFVKTTLMGLAHATALPWPEFSPAYDAKQAASYAYDLDKAKALLKEADVAAGTPLTIEYNTSIAELKEFAVLYDQELTSLGFKVTIEPVEPANYTTKNVNKEFKNLWLGPYSGASMYPSSLLTNNNPFRAGNNTSNFRNQEYEDLVAQASSEMDPAKQKEIFLKINQILLDESFNIPIANQPYSWVMSSKVDGLAYNKTNMIFYDKMTIQK